MLGRAAGALAEEAVDLVNEEHARRLRGSEGEKERGSEGAREIESGSERESEEANAEPRATKTMIFIRNSERTRSIQP